MPIANLAVNNVESTITTFETAVFAPASIESPAVKLVPVSSTSRLVPTSACVGLMPVSVGGGRSTRNETVPLTPPGVTTLMPWEPSSAAGSIVSVAVAVDPFVTETLETVMPSAATDKPELKLLPVNVTCTVAPWEPDAGATPVSVGGTSKTANVVNGTGRGRSAQGCDGHVMSSQFRIAAILKVAVAVVESTTFTSATVMPGGPLSCEP